MARAFSTSRTIYDYSRKAPEQPPQVLAALEIAEVKRNWADSRSQVDIREECDRIRIRHGLKPREDY